MLHVPFICVPLCTITNTYYYAQICIDRINMEHLRYLIMANLTSFDDYMSLCGLFIPLCGVILSICDVLISLCCALDISICSLFIS